MQGQRKAEMDTTKRKEEILKILAQSGKPVSGKELAQKLNVSRQVIVKDIALLRAQGNTIYSTNLGYLSPRQDKASRVFKTSHTDNEVVDELRLIVDCGGLVKDVFVYHKVYGVLRADLNIKSRADIDKFMEELNSGKSSLLKNITSSYHYHTVLAESEEILDNIQEKLKEAGFLAPLLDYEPVDFGGES